MICKLLSNKNHHRDSKRKIQSTFASCWDELWKIPHKKLRLLREEICNTKQIKTKTNTNTGTLLTVYLLLGIVDVVHSLRSMQELMEMIFAAKLHVREVIIIMTVWFWLACFEKPLYTERWQESPQTQLRLLIWPGRIQDKQSAASKYSYAACVVRFHMGPHCTHKDSP